MNKTIVSTLFLILFISSAYGDDKIYFYNSIFSGARYSTDSINYKSVLDNISAVKEHMKSCPECLDYLSSFKSYNSLAEICGAIAGVCVGWPIGGYLGGGKWESYYTPMMLYGGCGGLVLGIIFEITGYSKLKTAQELFNNRGKKLSLGDLDCNLGLGFSSNALTLNFSIVW
jgi:hypothetical protein